MCGRYSFTQKDGKKLKERFFLTKVPKDLPPRYNISPSQDVPVIMNESPKELSFARWGLIPSWSKEEKVPYSMINARAETLLEKPSYKRLVKSRRCLIPADSFYEWKKEKGQERKVPHRIMLKDGGIFAFAGLWDLWEKEDKHIYSCTIITTGPNKLVSAIHDRMPIILEEEREQDWLAEIDIEKAMELLKPYSASQMEAYPVSSAVNNPSNNSEEIIVPV